MDVSSRNVSQRKEKKSRESSHTSGFLESITNPRSGKRTMLEEPIVDGGSPSCRVFEPMRGRDEILAKGRSI